MNMRCCFNPKFLIAAAVLAGGTWFIAPNLALPVAVVLLGLSCPVSMFLAMRQSQGGSCAAPSTEDFSGRDPKRDEQIRALRAEIEDLRGQREKA